MSAPTVELITFPAVESIHQSGVKAAVAGDINGAIGHYQQANDLLTDIIDPTPGEASRQLHAARLSGILVSVAYMH